MKQKHPDRDPRKIGSSDVVAICGLSRFSSAFDVFLRITGKTGWNGKSNPVAEWGREVEDSILDNFERIRKVKLIRQVTYQHPDIDWAVATPDGVDRDFPVCVDAKNLDWERAEDLAGGNLPDYYRAQGIWQIGIYNAWAEKHGLPLLTESVFHVCIAGRPPQSFICAWDKNVFEKMMQIVHDFHAKTMRGIPPDMRATENVKQSLMEYFQPDDEAITEKTLVPADEDTIRNVTILKQLKAWEKELGEAIAFYEAQVCRKIGNAYGLDLGDGRRVIWPYSKGAVKNKALLDEIVKRTKFPLHELEELKEKFRGKPSRKLDLRKA